MLRTERPFHPARPLTGLEGVLAKMAKRFVSRYRPGRRSACANPDFAAWQNLRHKLTGDNARPLVKLGQGVGGVIGLDTNFLFAVELEFRQLLGSSALTGTHSHWS